MTLPTPTRTGYTFKGWADSASAASGTTGSYTPTSNVTLYAIWEQNAPETDAKLIVEKNRNGKTGIVNLKFFPALMEFRSIDHRYSDLDRSPDEKPGRN